MEQKIALILVDFSPLKSIPVVRLEPNPLRMKRSKWPRSSNVIRLPRPPPDADRSNNEISALREKGLVQLRVDWALRFQTPAPPIQSADILRRLFAYRLQTETFGDLDPDTRARLRRARTSIAKGKAPIASGSSNLRTGSVLVREWRGEMHRVLVRDNGFEHQGKQYGSLSEVARAISGTHWSGPRFFGLVQKPLSPSNKPTAIVPSL